MISDEEIDAALLNNITKEWRKLAFVVGMAMMETEDSQGIGRNDLFFALRIGSLAEKGLVEYKGDLQQIRQCEVRLSRRRD